ncbi:MAG: trigger factor [Chloroflexi bacterium]|nr:trigger factor [Chloroflexota bacterium]
MPVTTERLPRSLVALEIEVEADRLEAHMDKAVRRLSQRVRIPGFRPGKAPRQIVERTLGRPALLQEALEQLLPDVYQEAVTRESIEAIGRPSFELKSTEPLVVAATVPVRPTVNLADYQALRVPREPATATQQQVEEALEGVRRRYATLDPVDRPIAWGDAVRCDVMVSVEGQAQPHVEEGAEFRVTEGGVVSLPGFLERLVGLEAGGPHEFEFALPEDYEASELAGKQAHYTVTVLEVKQEVLPELDDAFVRSFDDEGLTTVDELRARVAENTQTRVQLEADAAYREEAMDLLLASADIDYPEVLVETEVERHIDQQSNHASHTREGLERWLESIGQTEIDLRETLRPQADLMVRRALVLHRLAEFEGIEVTPEDIEAEVDRLVERVAGGFTSGAGASEEQLASLRSIFDSPEQRQTLEDQLLTTRTLDRLVEIVAQLEGGDGEVERPRGSRRRRGARAQDGEADEAERDVAEAGSGEAEGGGSAGADSGEPGASEAPAEG